MSRPPASGRQQAAPRPKGVVVRSSSALVQILFLALSVGVTFVVVAGWIRRQARLRRLRSTPEGVAWSDAVDAAVKAALEPDSPPGEGLDRYIDQMNRAAAAMEGKPLDSPRAADDALPPPPDSAAPAVDVRKHRGD